MVWLSRNTKVLDSYSLKNGKLMPILCGQVTQGLGSLTFGCLVSATSMNDIPPCKAVTTGVVFLYQVRLGIASYTKWNRAIQSRLY